ncbi:MAG: hypothetical protein OHK0053_32450 [Microscillaceae bacterium]
MRTLFKLIVWLMLIGFGLSILFWLVRQLLFWVFAGLVLYALYQAFQRPSPSAPPSTNR